MLPKYWRLIVKNVSGQTQTYDSGARIKVRYTLWKIDSQGAISEAAIAEDTFAFVAGQTILTSGWVKMSAAAVTYIDNTAGKYWGIYGQIEITSNHASSAGPFELYIEFSGDISNWPSDYVTNADVLNELATHCALLAQITLTAAITESANFRYE